MKNIKYITVLLLFVNSISIYAQDPIDPMGDPGAAPINNGVLVLFIIGIAFLAYFVSKKQIVKSK